ncbi:MAG: hypothetical protein R2771_13300 [Saprospiraceae bacterium]
MKPIILILLFLYQTIQLYSQKDYIQYYLELNSIDSLFAFDNSEAAIAKFQALEDKGYNIRIFEYEKFADEIFKRGFNKLAEKYYSKAVEEGGLNQMIFENRLDKFKNKIIENYGIKTWNKYIFINQKVLNTVSKKHKNLASQLLKIHNEDQKLRNDIIAKRIEGKPSITEYGAGYRFFKDEEMDSSIHEEYMRLYSEFYEKDSINKQQFVDIVLDLGYIPTENELKGLAHCGFLVLHSAKFHYPEKFNEIVKESVENGRLWASGYGWYMGLKSDYQHTERIYYYSSDQDTILEFPEDKIQKINSERKKMGMKPCPAVIWNSRIYNVKKE